MNSERPRSRIQQLQDEIRSGLVEKIKNDFTGVKLRVLMQDIIAENNIETDSVHPETLRALGHYASVEAGETTNTAILFDPQSRTEWAGSGYDAKETAVGNTFTIVPLAGYELKRTPTREALTTVDIERRNSKERYESRSIGTHDHPQAQLPMRDTPKPRQGRHIPRGTSRLINRRGN